MTLSAQGIAGSVAETGRLINVTDAYEDPRFDQEHDRKTGYKTDSILCGPIRGRTGEVLGVIQAINKESGRFTAFDEDVLETLAAQAGIILQNSMLFQEAERSRDRVSNDVAMFSTRRRNADHRLFDLPAVPIPVGDYPCAAIRFGAKLLDIHGYAADPPNCWSGSVHTVLRGQWEPRAVRHARRGQHQNTDDEGDCWRSRHLKGSYQHPERVRGTSPLKAGFKSRKLGRFISNVFAFFGI